MNLKKLLKYNTFILAGLVLVKTIRWIIYGYMGVLEGGNIIYSIVWVIYLLAFIGIIKKKKWGSILLSIIIVIEIIIIYIILGNIDYLIFFIKDFILNLILLFLAYAEYNRLNKTNK